MSWKEFNIYTTIDAEEPVAHILNEAGANGVVVENIQDIRKHRENKYGEIYEIDIRKYPSSGIRIRAYYFADEAWPEKKQRLKSEIQSLPAYGIDVGDVQFTVHTVKEEDWENEWKKYFQVQKVTDHIVIVPEWEAYEAKEDEVMIKIDPGMAFGTGTHPTTRLSLCALEKYIQPGDVVIDVGSGSGILSIAASLLGAEHVYAYDLDPVAIHSAMLNRKMNQLDNKITIAQHDLLKNIRQQANIVVSNILAEILIDLIDDAWKNIADGGYLIISGIIEKKRSLVEDKLHNSGFAIIEVNRHDNWVSMIAKKEC